MKKRSTLLVALLSLVCLVCGAIGLAACGDKDVVIKVGETKISQVDADGATYKVEGDVGKEYVLTVKSKDVVCDGEDGHPAVHISMPENTAYSVGSYGTFTFNYFNGAAVKLVSETTIKNVKVVMEEKTYPAGDAKNPIAVELNKDVEYSVGFDYVYYSLSVNVGGTYEIKFTGTDADKVAVSYGSTVDDDGDYDLESGSVFTLEKDVKYVIAIASDKYENGNAVTVTGTFKIAEYTFVKPEPVDKGALTAAAPVTNQSIDSVGISLSVNFAEGKTYTITAKKGSETCNDVYIYASAGLKGYGTISFDWKEANATLKVEFTANTEVTGVTITLTEADIVATEYDLLTAGTLTVTTFPGSITEGEDEYPAHFYSFVVNQDTTYNVTVSAGGYIAFELDNETSTVDASFNETDPANQSVSLKAGTYKVTVVNYVSADSFTITIS